MPRHCRYFIPGIPQHVITRGVDKQAVFYYEQDYTLARQQAYRKLFSNLIDEGLLTRIRTNTNACGVIGDRRFKEQIAVMLGRALPTGKRGRPGMVRKKIGSTPKN